MPPTPPPTPPLPASEPPDAPPEPPDAPPEPPDAPPELLTLALERAVSVARRDAADHQAPAPPVALRPVLRFTKKLPPLALRSVLTALSGDESFRARVAEGADEAQLGRLSWLFLVRPQGWESEFSRLAEAATDEQRDTDARRADLDATRRAGQLEGTLSRLSDELEQVRSAGQLAETALAAERAARLAVEGARDELSERVTELDAARTRAVRELKEVEARDAARLAELRAERSRLEPLRQRVVELQAQLDARGDDVSGDTAHGGGGGAVGTTRADAPSSGPVSAPVSDQSWSGDDRSAVADAVARAASAAAALGAALSEAAARLSADGVGTLAGPSVGAPPGGSSSSAAGDDVQGSGTRAATGSPRPPRPPRRTPVRLRRGVVDGTPEALRQLLEVDAMVAFVDGYNVTMEGWPVLDQTGQRSRLLSALASVQHQVSAVIHVVFDGDADGGRPSVGIPLPVRVHFSDADTEADDVILAMVARLPTDVPVLVVSSDRRVAEGARRLGANAVASPVLLELLRR